MAFSQISLSFFLSLPLNILSKNDYNPQRKSRDNVQVSNMCLASILICVSVFKSSRSRNSSPDDVEHPCNLSLASQMLRCRLPLAGPWKALIPGPAAGAAFGASLGSADLLNLHPPSTWLFARSYFTAAAGSALISLETPRGESRSVFKRWRKYGGIPEDRFVE